MANQKRQTYSTKLKSRVAMEAFKEANTVAEIACKHKIHSTLVGKWKKQAEAGLPGIFADGRTVGRRGVRATEVRPLRELYEQVGRLKMENEWLKKNWNFECREAASVGGQRRLGFSAFAASAIYSAWIALDCTTVHAQKPRRTWT